MTKPFSFLISNFLFLILLCAVAVVPLLHADAPCSHDGAFHYYRVAAMRHALVNDGILFTRYLPDLAFGYGYPFFNYRAASSYYLALALHLIGLALPVALNLVYVLSIVASGLAAYLLARDLFGPQAGIVAAVAYAYAPYQFLNALVRGNAPESAALPLMPLILWAFRRLALTGQRRWFLVSVGSLSALYLTHNISSLLFTPFLVAYLLTLWLAYRREGHWIAAGGALILALGLIAFFLGPALLEQGYAQLHMSRVTRNNNFHYNFLSLAEILAPPAPVDTSLMNPPMRVHLGLAQAILGGLGLVIGLIRWRRDRERRATLIFLAITATAMIWMSTRSSLWLWEHVPLLPFVQFPWRLVGRAILPVALLASASFTNRPPASRPLHPASCLLPLASCLLILSAFPSTYPPHGYCANAPNPTINDVFTYERESKLVGVDPEGSYFPVWVKQRPEEGSPLEEQYTTGGPIARFDETVLPVGAFIVKADYGPNRASIVVETPTPFRARYLAFYFPGWRVWIDEEPVEITAADPEGFITFDVPTGSHTIAVRFGSTPTRTAFTAVSILSLTALAIVTIRYGRMTNGKLPGGSRLASTQRRKSFDGLREPAGRPRSPGIPSTDSGRAARSRLYATKIDSENSRNDDSDGDLTIPLERITTEGVTPRCTSYRSLFIVHCSLAILLLALRLGIADRTDTVFHHPTLQPDGALPGVERVLNQPYADGMTLIGYDQDRATLPADDELRVDLYWTAHTRPTARYQTVIHLIGADGMRWSMPDTARPRGYANYPPNFTWSTGRYALDSHQVAPLPGTPPGIYDVVLTIFNRDTLSPLSVLNEQGQPAAPELALGRVRLTAPSRPAAPDTLSIRHRIDTPLGPLTLLGADFDRDQAAPGDPVFLTTFWRADEQPTDDLTLHLALLAPDGFTAAEYKETRFFGKNLVSTGDTWRGQHLLRLPAHLDNGDHTWRLTLLPIYQSTNLPITTSITAPPHTFTAPPVAVEINTRLGDVATLIGVTLSLPHPVTLSPGHPLTITLTWQAENTPPNSYHVFLHLLDSEGKLMAQSDSIPASWSRPTTGWLPGEYISDTHALTIPPDAPAGDYVLSTGLYVPGGARLTTPDGADAIPLTRITVEAQ